MLYENIFGGLIFPWLICRASREASNGPGVLFPFAPKEEEQRARERALYAPIGWSLCPISAWGIYRRPLERLAGYELILYGLRIEGYTKRPLKAETRSIRLSREEIESYIEISMRTLRAMGDQFTNIITTEIHETRSINTDIKQIAEKSINSLYTGHFDIETLRESLLSIRALSEITTVRTDFLDFVANPSSLASKKFRPMQPYKKFDKVRKSLEFRAKEKKLKLNMQGNSFGYIEGLDIFEIVPYLIIQNAIKYTPKYRDINIEVLERADCIQFKTTNLGPLLRSDERSSLFEWGFRGEYAAFFANTGSGVGLYFLRELVVRHRGELELAQSESYESIGHFPFAITEVSVIFPRIARMADLFDTSPF
jgi:signal transduction histidine kinase